MRLSHILSREFPTLLLLLFLLLFCTYVICFRNQSGAVEAEKKRKIAKKNINQENGKPESKTKTKANRNRRRKATLEEKTWQLIELN